MAGIDWRKQELGNSLPELFALKKTRNTDARRGLTVIRIGAHVMVGK